MANLAKLVIFKVPEINVKLKVISKSNTWHSENIKQY